VFFIVLSIKHVYVHTKKVSEKSGLAGFAKFIFKPARSSEKDPNPSLKLINPVKGLSILAIYARIAF
jgi:hypothetical protein